jgi:hypothetical protein
MTTTIDGSLGITFPSGTNPQAAPSKVLQVVQATYSTQTSITSVGSFTNTGLSASITPLFSTSKILVLINQNYWVQSTSNGTASAGIQILRNSTAVYTPNYYVLVNANTTEFGGFLNLNYLDSPATTSSTTYTTQQIINTASGTTTFATQRNGCISSITLLEIAQ